MASELPVRCRYCLDDKVVVGLCFECQAKYERAERRAKEAERQAEAWKRSYWKLMNERKREIKRGMRP